MEEPLVPEDFPVPPGFRHDLFRFEPLGVQHNPSDHEAWTSSIDHIKSTPGFAGRGWPDQPMSLVENAAEVASHAKDFAQRTGFAYSVLDPVTADVIGCVYLYPPRRDGYDVDVRSWVRADRAELDKVLYDVVCQWLKDEWPFEAPDYADRT